MSTTLTRSVTSEEVVRTFLEFFERHDHLRIPHAPLVPEDDPTLLFVNSGMAPLKPYFLGEEEPPRRELANVQPCIRTKDIEDVGDRHHLTLFEMLGSWSIGGYWKKRAVELAWELLTEGFGYDPERLYASVYAGDETLGIGADEESARAWEAVGMAAERIVPLGADNFWGPAGPYGPCGPCTEVFFDTGPEHGPAYEPGGEFDTAKRYIEIWNAGVFMEFDKQPEGLTKLDLKSVDTGSGLERMVMVLNGQESVYETDRLLPIVELAAEELGISGTPTDSAEARRVADHLRASAFILAEGVTPSNLGRGYIPRRLVRRVLALYRRHERKLDAKRAMGAVFDVMGRAYPHLLEASESIVDAFEREAGDFESALDHGFGRLEEMTKGAEGEAPHLSGEEAMTLFTTYGLPLDLIRDHLEDRGGTLDEEGFEEAYRRHQEVSRSGASGLAEAVEERLRELAPPTAYDGDTCLELDGQVRAILVDGELADEAPEGTEVGFVTDRTSFYAEGGGQVGDRGVATGPEGEVRVDDTVKVAGVYHLHRGEVVSGVLRRGDAVRLEVTGERRRRLRAHHSATHLLQAALRAVLGEDVRQAGSKVEPDKLRFDFTHPSKMTDEERREVERRVNRMIQDNLPTEIATKGYDEAIAAGALAFFGDTYGDEVRVVRFGDVSTELCGGSHVAATGDIGLFRIVSEGSVGSGVRRVTAVAGEAAVEHTLEREAILERLAQSLNAAPEQLEGRVGKLLERGAAEPAAPETPSVRELAAGAEKLPDGTPYLAARVDAAPGDLRSLGLEVADAVKGVVALVGEHDGKAALVVAVDKPLTERFAADRILRELLPHLEGRGGGKAHLAQGGGPKPEGIGAVLESLPGVLEAEAG